MKKLKFVIVALGLGLAGGFAASSLGHEEASAVPCCSQCDPDRPVSPCTRICIHEC